MIVLKIFNQIFYNTTMVVGCFENPFSAYVKHQAHTLALL